jgi:uncharacterized protein (UPF0333 family)
MSINQLHKDITNLLYRVEEDYSKIIQFGEHVPLIELDIVLKDVRLLYEYFNELKYHAEEQRRKNTPKEKTQESAAIVAAEKMEEKVAIISSLLNKKDEVSTEALEEKKEPVSENENINEFETIENAEIEITEDVEEVIIAEEENVVDETAAEEEISQEEENTPIAETPEIKEIEKKEEVKVSPIAWQKTFDAGEVKTADKLGTPATTPPPVAPKVDLLKEREKDFVPTVRKIEFKKELNQPEPKKESIFEKAASLYDKISKPTDKSIAAQHSRQPISNIKSTIGINDKFIYLKELFKGNVEEYGAALDKLNDFDSYAEAEDYFQELKEKYNWDPDTKSFHGLAELLLRRYL